MSLLGPLYRIYEWQLIRKLSPENMPKHVALIMDGNRRYSKRIGESSVLVGHERGVATLEKVLDWSIELGINIITVYAFSLENFKRSEEEVEGLMDLFETNFKKLAEDPKIHKNKVRLQSVGKIDVLPQRVIDAIKYAEDKTKNYTERMVNVAIGYDGRLEIVDAAKKLAQDVKDGKIEPEDITEELFDQNLYTAGLEDPNLVMRTSGEERLSGFLLWQSSYSELYFCDTLWPELRKVDFLRALRSYQERERRFGI